MKKKIQFVLLLALGAFVIALGIRAGHHHDDCRECPLAIIK